MAADVNDPTLWTDAAVARLANDLAQTTTMSFDVAKERIRLAIAWGMKGDRIEPVIREYSAACGSGLMLGSFEELLRMLTQFQNVLGDAADGPFTIRVVKDKGGPHGDG
jgi:hypothetical protein